MGTDVGQGFWQFSLAHYGKPGLSPAVIGLQDRLGADVNLLLYGCWAAAEGRALGDADIAKAEASIQLWREQVVEPLRAVRNRLKQGVAPVPTEAGMALRKRVLDAEIAGEELAQNALAALLPQATAAGNPAAAARSHIDRYLARLAKPLGGEDQAAVETLIKACFG
ncbi:TIGR02444 family protein [Hypericibacter sp.]|uniref:TIGR02444 family protein n=1 Tax=Hypericibacter sp. TaxID=2705401 RepID=UPI003D6CB000